MFPEKDAGGVYVTLVVVVPERVPHWGEQAAPPDVSVQVTPLLVESFCTVALTTNALVPVFTELFLLGIVTTIAGLIVKELESDLDPSLTDLAVSVACVFAGRDAGGVYVTLVAVAPERLPQAGEQEAPPAVSVQVTPLLVESFCTAALTTIPLAPVVTDVNLFEMVTATAAELIVNESESDLFVWSTDVAVIVG